MPGAQWKSVCAGGDGGGAEDRGWCLLVEEAGNATGVGGCGCGVLLPLSDACIQCSDLIR